MVTTTRSQAAKEASQESNPPPNEAKTSIDPSEDYNPFKIQAQAPKNLTSEAYNTAHATDKNVNQVAHSSNNSHSEQRLQSKSSAVTESPISVREASLAVDAMPPTRKRSREIQNSHDDDLSIFDFPADDTQEEDLINSWSTRKANIVKFGPNGPQNQAMPKKTKRPRISSTRVTTNGSPLPTGKEGKNTGDLVELSSDGPSATANRMISPKLKDRLQESAKKPASKTTISSRTKLPEISVKKRGMSLANAVKKETEATTTTPSDTKCPAGIEEGDSNKAIRATSCARDSVVTPRPIKSTEPESSEAVVAANGIELDKYYNLKDGSVILSHPLEDIFSSPERQPANFSANEEHNHAVTNKILTEGVYNDDQVDYHAELSPIPSPEETRHHAHKVELSLQEVPTRKTNIVSLVSTSSSSECGSDAQITSSPAQQNGAQPVIDSYQTQERSNDDGKHILFHGADIEPVAKEPPVTSAKLNVEEDNPVYIARNDQDRFQKLVSTAVEAILKDSNSRYLRDLHPNVVKIRPTPQVLKLPDYKPATHDVAAVRSTATKHSPPSRSRPVGIERHVSAIPTKALADNYHPRPPHKKNTTSAIRTPFVKQPGSRMSIDADKTLLDNPSNTRPKLAIHPLKRSLTTSSTTTEARSSSPVIQDRQISDYLNELVLVTKHMDAETSSVLQPILSLLLNSIQPLLNAETSLEDILHSQDIAMHDILSDIDAKLRSYHNTQADTLMSSINKEEARLRDFKSLCDKLSTARQLSTTRQDTAVLEAVVLAAAATAVDVC